MTIEGLAMRASITSTGQQMTSVLKSSSWIPLNFLMRHDFFSILLSAYWYRLDFPADLLTLSTRPAARWKLFNASIH